MSDTSSNTTASRAPAYSEGDLAVWIRNTEKGNFASISQGPQNNRQIFKMNADIKGLDRPLTGKELISIFKGLPVEVMLQPRDTTKQPYQVFLGRNTDEAQIVPWKTAPSKVDNYVNVRMAIPVYRQQRNGDQPVVDENGQAVMRLKGYRIGKDNVEYPAWVKHGEKWVGLSPVDALYLDNNQPRVVRAHGQDYQVSLLQITEKPGQGDRVWRNAQLSVTLPGEQIDQAQGQAVNYDQTQPITDEAASEAASEEAATTPGNTPY